MFPVPGGRSGSSNEFDGPSGVLICCEDHIIWRDMDAPQHRIPIPRRKHPLADSDRGIIIIAAVMHKMRVSVLSNTNIYLVFMTFFLREHSSSCYKAKRVTFTRLP
jgi:hypothetical protein